MNIHNQETGYFFKQNLTKSHIMLFDLATGGHHPSYILHIVRYWCNQKLPNNLDIVVSPKFLDEHNDIVKFVIDNDQKNIRFVPISWEEYSDWNSKSSLLMRIFQEWRIYVKYATKLKADHGLLMYFDTLQLPIILGAKSPCSFSGIYFRPTLHYHTFDNYVPSWKDRLREWLKKIILSIVLCNSQLKFLFSLDPLAIKHIENFNTKAKILHLPDPVEIYDVSKVDESKVTQIKTRLGIDSGRKVFLLFGRISPRKGIYQLLEAISYLETDVANNLCLLIVGSSLPGDKLPVENQIKKISESVPVQIIINSDYIAEEDVHLYFSVADVILAPYQNHVGMSGILLLAAAAQKPVLSSNYGLMGHLVVDHQLGITVDSRFPSAIASAITTIIHDIDSGQTNFYNLSMMKEFAEQNSAVKFAHVLISNIC
jgi:glycosyltransferase involved in cell wall biosynthesis